MDDNAKEPKLNTKARHLEIYGHATSLIEKSGGVVEIDQMETGQRVELLRSIYRRVAEEAGCTLDTAKRNVAKALRRGRFKQVESWGGAREGAGLKPTDKTND